MTNLPEIFGSMVFNDAVMKQRLPETAYESLKRTMSMGQALDRGVADIVANAMKDWATEKGVTHYTHWFQPLTGITAEKHDSFIVPTRDGGVVMELTGKELIKGEPDASSFPSGGIRATFEARGYTAWDPTSYAFIKDGVLCIPTAFCSYGGEALDKKTPLLRSMEAVNTQAMRILRLFGVDCGHVGSTVGLEQEYFLIDRDVFNQRKDLVYTGRTLLGAKPPKGQELEDHYFGSIRIRISGFMKELNEELWRLGILAKTEHNEAAPAQHELAPVFTTMNVAVDHNQITMEIMRKVAKRHGLTCLLHEKPFANLNGSGKHNNWSLTTDTGINLFEPGKTPEKNAQFLTFFCAVLAAVDEYQDLLRISVASAGNDHRLGGNEAPPAILSVFVGEELGAILDSIMTGEHYDKIEKTQLKIGVDALPPIPRDTTDRNRTSPFAFTGNKFEFRMLGSSASAADVNMTLNTIVAEQLCRFADRLERASDFNSALDSLIRETVQKHSRIIFNGNGYDKSWALEAQRRGLSNFETTAQAVPHLTDEHNIALFKKHGIMSEKELFSRRDIALEGYCKNINIEGRVLSEMIRRDVYPAVLVFSKTLADTIVSKHAAVENVAGESEKRLLLVISQLSDELADRCDELDNALESAAAFSEDYLKRSERYEDEVLPIMSSLRIIADELETVTPKDIWPYPSYGRILYRV